MVVSQHSLTSTHVLEISFPSNGFAIGSSLTCSSNLTTTCSAALISSNLIRISNMVSNTVNSLRIEVENIQNPENVGQFDSLSIVSRTAEGYLVDSEQSGIFFSVIARELDISDIAIVSTSNVVYNRADIRIETSTKNAIPTNSRLYVLVPTDLILTGLSCSPYC